jgi:hypothetical protein
MMRSGDEGDKNQEGRFAHQSLPQLQPVVRLAQEMGA